MPYPGESASLLTSLCYVVSAVVFTRAARRVGSPTVNGVRLGAALLVMMALHQALLGSLFPAGAGLVRLAWLGASGLIGFALGDALLFEAYLQLGPRLTLLVYTLWPVMSALMAWAFLGESMGLRKSAAMLVTVAGVALVVAEPGRTAGTAASGTTGRRSLGLLLAIGAAAGQAVGFIFAKVGMAGGFSPVSANTIRVAVGTASLWAWQALRRELGANLARLRDGRASALIVLGSLFGPVAGVVLSLYAINHARYLGVASTLMSLSPVLILPVSVWVEKERVGLQAWAGTLVCFLGTVGLVLK
jgi:drug/metabolite transporter (DMT)-like permease